MSKTAYRVIRQNGSFAVEMLRANGDRHLIPDFRDQHEADAWIVQAKRLRSVRDLHDKFASRPKKAS